MPAKSSNRGYVQGGIFESQFFRSITFCNVPPFFDHFFKPVFPDFFRIFSGRFFLLHILFGRTHLFEIPKFQNFIFRFFEIHKISFAESSYADSRIIFFQILFSGSFLFFKTSCAEPAKTYYSIITYFLSWCMVS